MDSNITVALLWRAGKQVFPGNGLKNTIKRLRFWAFQLLHFSELRQWIQRAGGPALRAELACAPYLLKTISGPYINRAWSFSDRIQIVADHYRLSEHLRLAFLNMQEGHFWHCTDLVAEKAQLKLVFDRPEWMRSEGEWTISLFDGNSRVYAVALSLGGTPDALHLYLGAIQGDAPGLSIDLYAQLTKYFHGMRPRDLLLNMVKIFAKNVGCQQILCVSDAQHQSIGRNNESDRLAKYDQIWAENGGTETAKGFYSLPAHINERDSADIPVRKRAMYRRRYQFLADAERAMAHALRNTAPLIEKYNYPT